MPQILSMRKQPLREQFRIVHAFLGKRVFFLLVAGVVTGFLLFGIELAFAYALQSFFLTLGIANVQSVKLPGWVPQSSTAAVLSFLLILGLVRGLLYWAQQYMPQAALEESRYQHRSRILKWAFHSESVSSSQTTTLFSELTNGAGFALMNIQTLVVQITSALFLAVTLFVLSQRISIVAFAMLFFLVVPLRSLDTRIHRSSNTLWTEWEKTNSSLLSSIKNLLLMQIYGTQTSEEKKAQTSLRKFKEAILEHFLITGLKYSLPQIFGIVVVCVIALMSRKIPSTSSGMLVSYLYIFIRFTQCLAICAQSVSGFITYRTPLLKLFSWWKAGEDLGVFQAGSDSSPSQSKAQMIDVETPIGWSLNTIVYQYPGALKPVLNGLNLTIAPGEATVILGPSGAGKSTLLNLILGGVEPGQGDVQVTFNQKTQALADVKSSVLRNIGYVGPESFLIEGTIMKNILYGLAFTPSAEEIERALTLSGCDFLASLPQGLEHVLTEQGQGLSAGQKQRISLARALLRRPRALILDEATSNLDEETESKLVATFKGLKRQITIVAVTHRKSLLDIADQRFTLEPQ
ncbi:MAG: ABC transporter ATP-binding protein [Methylotenera sp.]|nr:ABC transporter ATP-binding protein [Oligoflexia bacterium]